MLAELAAINSAYATIKATIAAGRELHSCGSALASFMQNEEQLQKKHKKAKNSLFGSVNENDLETFMAIEAANQKKQELKEFMLICGRPGLHQDWVRFERDQRLKRQEAEEERKRKLSNIINNLIVAFLILGLLGAFGGLVAIVYLARQGYL